MSIGSLSSGQRLKESTVSGRVRGGLGIGGPSKCVQVLVPLVGTYELYDKMDGAIRWECFKAKAWR